MWRARPLEEGSATGQRPQMEVELPLDAADECDGTEPPWAEVLADARAAEPVAPNRLPAPGRAR